MKLIHEDATKDGLEFLYKYIFGVWLFIVSVDPLVDLAYLPLSTYTPTGFLLKFWPQSVQAAILSIPFLVIFKGFLLVSLACVVLNKFRPSMIVLACLFLTFYQGLVRSFGHINHPDLMLLLSTWILAVFSFTNELDAKNKVIPQGSFNSYAIPFIVILFIYTLTYAFAGVHRVVYGGLEIFTSDSIIYWILENGKRSREVMWNLEGLVLQYPWLNVFVRFGYVLATIFEILAPFILLSSTFRYIFIFVMVPFHAIIFLFMGIFFWHNLVLYVLFFDSVSKIKFRSKG